MKLGTTVKNLVLAVVASSIALAPMKAAPAQTHPFAQILTPYECELNVGAFAGFVTIVNHGLHFLVLQASLPSPNTANAKAGGFVTVPGQPFTGFQYDIDQCYATSTHSPGTFAVGDDEFGNSTFALYYCSNPSSEQQLPNGFTRKFWAPDAWVSGISIPVTLNKIVIYLSNFTGDNPVTINVMNVRVNGRGVTNNLRGLQGCSALDGI